MLGKRSHPLLGTTGNVNLPPGEDHHTTSDNRQTSSTHSFLPQRITIGFEVPPPETKPSSDACESPRSVLDVNVTTEKHLCGRSFRSCVQGVPLRNKERQGIGLAIIVDIHAEEKGHDCSLLRVDHGSASVCVHRHGPDQLNSFSLHSKSQHTRDHHQRSQPITIVANCNTQYRPAARMLSKNAEMFPENIDDGGDDDRDDDDDDDDDSSSRGSMEFFGSDYISSWRDYVLHDKSGCKMDDDGYIIRPSLFAIASVPSDHGSYGIQSASFLEVCAFCLRDFVPGKDIFMYRGDQAFCSVECRGERIKIDEYQEKLITMYS